MQHVRLGAWTKDEWRPCPVSSSVQPGVLSSGVCFALPASKRWPPLPFISLYSDILSTHNLKNQLELTLRSLPYISFLYVMCESKVDDCHDYTSTYKKNSINFAMY